MIGDRPLDELVPLYRDPRSEMPVTQFDYEDAEKAGLVKFDFLGLKTLTVIAKAEELLSRRGIELNTQTIDFDDRPTFEMLARGESVGVFQLEGAGHARSDAQDEARPHQRSGRAGGALPPRPDGFDPEIHRLQDRQGEAGLSASGARADPEGNLRRHDVSGRRDATLPASSAAIRMGQADLLRRAMGKKIASEMAKHREIFMKGAREKGVDASVAEQIFEQAAKFAGYGFNKGHAAAYAQVAYQTAYLKANYPVEFLAASMTLDIGNTDRLNIFRQEAQRLGIEVLPPDINRSEAAFACDHERGVIYYALAAVKGVGRQAMDHVVAVRKEGGPFASIADFARRIDPQAGQQALPSKAWRAPAPSMRSIPIAANWSNPPMPCWAMPRARRASAKAGRGRCSATPPRRPTICGLPPWPNGWRMSGWARSSARSASISPAIRSTITPPRSTGFRFRRYAQCEVDRRQAFVALLAGTIIKKSERRSRNDQYYAFVSFSDPTGMFEVMFFPEVLAASRPLLEPGSSVLLKVNATWEGDELKLRALSVTDLDKAAAGAGEGLRIYLDDTAPLNAIAGQLREPGKGIVTIVVPARAGQEVEVKLAKTFQVTGALKGAIKSLPGVAAVESV